MENWQKQIKVPTVVLFVLTLVMFVLMWVPGVIHLSMYEGKFDSVYLNPIANDPYSALSGLITGLSLPVLVSLLRAPSHKRITVAAVMLEMAAVLAFLKLPLGLVFQIDNNTPLSYAIGVGNIAAMILAIYIQKKVPYEGKVNPFSRKQMALYMLILVAVFAATYVEWAWKYVWPDLDIECSYQSSLFGGISSLFTAFAANFVLLHCLGIIKGRPTACGVCLLAAVVCTIIAFISLYHEFSPHVVVLPPTYIISAIQVAVGLRLLLGKHKKTEPSSQPA